MCHEHQGGQSGVLTNLSSSVWTCLMSSLVLVHVCGVVHFPRGGGTVFTDFLPDSDCPVKLHLSENRPVVCILLREGSRLSSYYCVGGNPEFTSDSKLLVSRLEYWSSSPFGRLGLPKNCKYVSHHYLNTAKTGKSFFSVCL